MRIVRGDPGVHNSSPEGKQLHSLFHFGGAACFLITFFSTPFLCE